MSEFTKARSINFVWVEAQAYNPSSTQEAEPGGSLDQRQHSKTLVSETQNKEIGKDLGIVKSSQSVFRSLGLNDNSFSLKWKSWTVIQQTLAFLSWRSILISQDNYKIRDGIITIKNNLKWLCYLHHTLKPLVKEYYSFMF